MTFDDDFIQLEFSGSTKRIPCKVNGLEWPPPEKIEIYGIQMERVSMSQLTDEQRQACDHIMRGALYRPSEDQHVGENDEQATH